MKFWTMVMLVCTVLIQSAYAEEHKVYAGAGPYFQTQPYAGADMQLLPSPALFYDNDLVYLRWTRVGVYFAGESSDAVSWGLSLTAQPRPYGYKSGDAKMLKGMKERHNSWEGGLCAALSTPYGYVELMALSDLLDNSNGGLVSLEFGKKLQSGPWTFLPAVSAIWYDRAFNDYYYGVRKSEENRLLQRPAYKALAGVNAAAQFYLFYDIAPQWHLFSDLRIDWHDSPVTDSPIVDKATMLSGIVSLLYSFAY